MYRIALPTAVLLASTACSPLYDPDDPSLQDIGVSITSPSSGAAVSGLVTVSATAVIAADAIASVRFDLPDGTSLADTAPPFAITWDTTTVADGPGYVVRATAFDGAGASSAASVSVTVANGGIACGDGTFAASDLPVGIPDDGVTGLRSRIHVAGPGAVASLVFSMSIAHDFPSDLEVRLISPTGDELIVSDPQAPSLHVTNQLVTAFGGEAVAGDWTLDIQDLVPGGRGRLTAWSLAIAGDCGVTAHRPVP